MRYGFTFPETMKANVVIDAFDSSSYIMIIPEGNKVIGYSTDRIRYGNQHVPTNFKNYFVIYKEYIMNFFIEAQLQKEGNILYRMISKPNFQRSTKKESFLYSVFDRNKSKTS